VNPDDDREYDPSDESDPETRQLGAEILRLEAQLDQLAAAVREQATESAELHAMLADLEERMRALEARRRFDHRVLVWAVPLVWAFCGASVTFLILG
jgi:septal ring factor EnvC (AmiA/AmiB activator)